MSHAVAVAEKALQDYFDSLDPETRVKALQFQAELEAEVAVTEGGWNVVILKRLKHLNMCMIETLDDYRTAITETGMNEVRTADQLKLESDVDSIMKRISK